MENKYFLYARKSSEPDDRQVLSIESQVSELKELAQKQGLKIIDILVESKSAKEPGRPVFNEMIERIRADEANGILCWKLDRLARNPVDGGQISWLLQQGVIQSIQTFEKEYKPSDNVLLMSVELGMANQFIRDLSETTKRGLRTKLEMGWLPEVAPLGYLNDKTKDRGQRTIIKDPERFDLVRKMWDLMLTGAYTPPKIWEIATYDWKFTTFKRKRLGGGPMSRSTIYEMFKNPFYYGWFGYKGQLYKGSHEPMVTEDEFWRVQALLGERGRPRPKSHQFAFTGMIRCGECGGMITAEEKFKVNKTNPITHHYIYYRCTKRKPGVKCSQPFIREEDLERQIEQFLATLTISDRFLKWALKYLNEANDDEIKTRTKIYQSQQKAYNDIQKHLDNLTQMRYRELITDEEYLKEKEKLLTEKERLKVKLESTEQRAESWLELTEKTFVFSHQARYRFNHGSLEDKKIILQTVGSNLVLKDKILQIQPVKPFLIIQKGLKTSNWLRRSDLNRQPWR